MPDLIRKDPERLRPGIDPAWWCAPIVIGLALGVLLLIFEYDGSNYAQLLFPVPRPAQNLKGDAGPERSPEKPDPQVDLAEELKKELKSESKNEFRKDAAVTQPPEVISPYEAAIRQLQKGK